MDGKTLEPFINSLDVSQAEVARKLGMSNQSLNNMLTHTKDIRTGFIEKLAKVYKKPISYFFDEVEASPTIIEAVDHSVAAANSSISIGDFRELQSKVEFLEGKIEDQKRIIALQEKIINSYK